MPANNLVMQSDIDVATREIEFTTSFDRTWEALREVLGIMRPVKKAPGTSLKSYKATAKLESGDVGEGELIPYSHAQVEEVKYRDLSLKKYSTAVTIEAVQKYGAENAVRRTDDAFRNELQTEVMEDMYRALNEGTLTGVSFDLQAAIAMAIGRVRDKFKKMRKTVTKVVVFINTLDYYSYLANKEITLQTREGVNYLKDFLGADTVILSSEIERGTVIATPVDNLILYYVDPSNSDFKELGLNYTVSGETNLIGYHANGDYSHAVGESFALMGMVIWAEYIDGIAINKIEAQGEGKLETLSASSAAGTDSGTKITISSEIKPDWTFFVKSDTTAPKITYLSSLDATWQKIDITEGNKTADNIEGLSEKATIVAVNGAGQAVAASGSVTVTNKA